MKKYIRQLIALTMITSILLVGCGSSAETADVPEKETTVGDASIGGAETLTIAITKDENTLAPFTYVSGTGLTVNRLIYDTLMTTDTEDEIIPWMVEDDYEVVDFKEYTFTLKDGQKFHNGNPVTAEDIKFSFEYSFAFFFIL